MVDTDSVNGEAPALVLPEVVVLASVEARRIPSPGAQRALRAETGRSYDELCGPDADSADRFQTLIWMQLRRTHPGVRWADCEDISLEIDEEALAGPDPTKRGASATSQPSAASGG